MKIAYLIIVHNNPNHFYRLIKALSSSNSNFFIHIDQKSKLSDFSKITGKNIYFCKDRVPVYWGEFSLVQATINLIRQALESNCYFDYYILLSGVDYPLKSNLDINQFLQTHKGNEFINRVKMPCPEAGKPISRLIFYKLETGDYRRQFVNHCNGITKWKRDYKKYLGKLVPYGGSAWWALTPTACQYILDFLDREPNIVNYFVNTHIPEEMFFQTILENSQFKERIKSTLTYVDWSNGGTHPPLITDKHLELFESNHGSCKEKLFARKFSDESYELVERIERMKREKELQTILACHQYNTTQEMKQKFKNMTVNKTAKNSIKSHAIRLRKKHKHSEKQQDKIQVPSQANWKVIAGETIEGFPNYLRLPPIIGNGNDYTFIDMQLRQFIATGQPYTLPVSIIIQVYNRKAILAKTLAALTHQTYPAELIEVIVADDGSSDSVEEVIEKYQQHLTLKHVYQEDLGYRLAAVRNLGINAATHDSMIILDCDMLPMPNLVESFMQYLHITNQAVLIGHRRFVCTDDINDDDILKDVTVATSLPDIVTENVIFDNEQTKPTFDWRLNTYQNTHYLKEAIFPSNVCSGGNVAFARNIVNKAGYFDEDFQAWGGEDGEWSFRIYNAGYYFIPVLHAVGLHQEPPDGENETDRLVGREKNNKILEEKCPILYRQYRPHKLYNIPKVSIYIPAYNAGKHIKEAIDSALAQTYTDVEVCIVNDGSTDNTLRVIENHYPNNPRVRWLTQQNGGIGKVSNAAVRLCRGIYIGQLDADDILKPHAVETMVDYLDNHNVGCVYGSCEMIDASGNYIQDGYNWPVFSREKLMCTMIVHHFRMFRKRDWLRTTGFNEQLKNAVDYDMYLKLSEVCTIHHLDKIMYAYRWHGENTSIVHKTQQFENHVQVIRLALERLGLDKDWEVYSPNQEDIRKVEFRKKNKVG